MTKHLLYALVLFALTGSALAQEAPPPRKMPRVPVNREAIQDRKTVVPSTREVQGQAIIIDGERLRIGDLDLRLFGVVPPQLSASFGPQARTALDELTVRQNIVCQIRDRDREERFLAICHNANNADLALELLRRGLAVTARGSVASTELAASYIAAEQAAEAQKIGLWSVVVPAAAALPETPKVDAPPPIPVHVQIHEEKQIPTIVKSDQNQSPVADAVAKASVASSIAPGPSVNNAVYATPSEPGFLIRYQLLVTGMVMLITALGLFGAVTIQRLRDRRAEMQAIAAALRGELMAAHAVCRARLRSSASAEDKDVTWPRLRSTLYQAYVGRLGWLGAELARRVASIYGQASDYAAYYAGDDETRTVLLPKRQALQTLVQHIDDVLPRLAIIEHTGNPSSASTPPQRSTAVLIPIPSPAVPVTTARSSANNPSASQVQSVTTGAVSESIKTVSSAAATSSSLKMWTVVQKLARTPWSKKKTVEPRDPIAEYTALIEEEMKRFSFIEDDGESEPLPSPDVAANGWPQKSHEAF